MISRFRRDPSERNLDCAPQRESGSAGNARHEESRPIRSRRQAMTKCLPLLSLATLLMGCGAGNTPSSVRSPGDSKTAKSQLLGHGADMLQAMPPVAQINMYLN